MFYQKKNNKLEPLTGSTLYAETPIGTVIASFLAVAPSGYIKCDGTVYTKAAYPELYERIPDVFKDTTNETFTIDLREVALKGIGLSSLTTSHYSSTGLTLGEFIEDRLQQHKHSQTAVLKLTYGYSTSNRVPTTGSGNYSLPSFTGSAADVFSTQTSNILVDGTARFGATTEVKSVGVNYFIKAKHVALPIDIMDAISEEYATKEYVDEVTTVDLSSFLSSSFTLTSLGAHAYIHGKEVRIMAHFTCNVALGQQAATVLSHLDTVLPAPINGEFVSGAAYFRDSSSSSAYKAAFSAYNPNGNCVIYTTQSASSGSLFEINITYTSE